MKASHPAVPMWEATAYISKLACDSQLSNLQQREWEREELREKTLESILRENDWESPLFAEKI